MKQSAFLLCALIASALYPGTAALAQSHDLGVAAGRAANDVIRGMVNRPSATAVVPGYTEAPPEVNHVNSPNLRNEAILRMAACAATPDDLTCQAILGAHASAATPRPAVGPDDPSVQAARAIAQNPGAQGVALHDHYTACSPKLVLQSPATFDTQSCHDYLLRSTGNSCHKTLAVTVNWQCPAEATTGPTRNVDPMTSAASWTCQVPQPRMESFCTAPLTGPTLASAPPFAGLPVCTDGLGLQTPAPTRQVVESYCPPPLTGPTLATSGPMNGAMVCTDSSAAQSPAPTRPVVDLVTEAATPLISESWTNGCASLEALVPAGYLAADGDNTPPTSLPPMSGPLEKCSRTHSTCTIPDETRVINDHPVTRACWRFDNSFDCLILDARSDCAQPRFGDCTALPPPTCIDTDDSVLPAVCTAYRHDFRCQVTGPVYRSVEDCGTQTFCAGGTCFDTGFAPDTDFARSVAMIEATREAGRYLDPQTLRVFRGFDNRCVKKLFGLVNCCSRSGSSAASLFTNFSIASAALPAIGKAAVSNYTYDALFTSDAPSYILSGFEALWGTGYASGLAGVIAGDVAVSSFISSIVPGWWTLAILAIQASGIMSCPETEQTIAMKRDARLCVELGSYCSRKIRLIGTCLEQTQSHCCFNSRLARIVNQQGLLQVGRGFGSARNPDCNGFSVAELQSLDFAAMDLSEFYAEIAPTPANLAALQSDAAARVPVCYFGNGRC